ncbi:hypothetical protein N656DRAFT_821906 [Canariomyces notabilis]|uniref:Uncharacterized protein n=1 Tax=Canariomyces notabilis TaxID=2074819 RepID=A0AAN6QE13_9PEZI|nr:hypothetical protein N656DRAFT_821906 [Canariomyces arenarius]
MYTKSLHFSSNMVYRQYQDMVVESYHVPYKYNIAAGLSSWILLASFILFPGTFTSLEQHQDSGAGKALYHFAQRIPLLLFSGLCCLLGVIGTTFLWVKFRYNYVWLLSHLISPGLLNSVSGLLSVLVGIYASHDGEWSVTAKVTIGVVTLSLCSMSVAYAIYRFWLLRRISDMSVGQYPTVDQNGLGATTSNSLG